MTKLAAILSACLALALVAAGCGSDDDGGGSEPAKTSEQKQPAPGGGDAAAATEVSMKDIQFKPKTVTVSKGDTVKWTNDDTAPHDVTGPGFRSGPSGGMETGATYERTFNKAGTFNYRCTVHSGMAGSVVVK